MSFTRRQFVKSASAAVGMFAMPNLVATSFAATEARPFSLRAGFTEQEVLPGQPKIRFWGFNDSVPGPLLRYCKGEHARLVVSNDLATDTAVHWHGVRVPNAMDGVPFVTQDPIKPGSQMLYDYQLRDSGTYWYHPHQASFEQVPRGLYGALIVEEDKPIEVDRDVVWLLSDIKLGKDGQQVEDYGRIMDLATEGRIGNQILLNGRAAGPGAVLDVTSGERIRLRLINAASARIFRLAMTGHQMNVIAHDGQAAEPHLIDTADLGPGMRLDIIVDCVQAPGSSFAVTDVGHRGAGPIASIRYSAEKPMRSKPMTAPIRLVANEFPEPDVARATDHYIMFQGGMRGAPVIGKVDGQPTKVHEMMEKHGLAWTMNYTAQHEHALMHEPLIHLKEGEHVVLHMVNETDYSHPMHLHGHFFRVLAVNGKANPRREWRDTVLMGPRQTIDVAFVADNLGEWMFHCHILDHAAGGMMGTIAVG